MNKIMFIVPFLSSGGAERVASIWASELAKLGAEIHLLLFYRVRDEYPLNKGVKVHAIKENREQYDQLSKFEKVKLLRLKLKNVKPDVIVPFITHVGLVSNFARLGLNIKLIETIRIDPKYSPQNRVLRILRNISVLLSNSCIVQNKEQKDYFPRWIHNKIYVFSNPISNEFLQAKRVNINSTITSITAIGRLESQKNYPMLINAFAKLKNSALRLSIYGEGSLKNQLQNLIDDIGFNDVIKLYGRTNNIKEVLTNSDLFVLCSNAEGMPNSLMEAMAVGLPCISTDCPTGPSDLINNQVSGILIPVGDEEALVYSISQMIQNPEEAFTMGERAKEKIKTGYAANVSTKKLLSFLNTV